MMKKEREYIQRWIIRFSTGRTINFPERYIIHPPISQNWKSMKEPLYLHGSPKLLAGRLTIPLTPPVAAPIKTWKLIANQLFIGPQQLRKTHLSRVWYTMVRTWFTRIKDTMQSSISLIVGSIRMECWSIQLNLQLEQEKRYQESISVDRTIHIWHHCPPPRPKFRTPLRNWVIKI